MENISVCEGLKLAFSQLCLYLGSIGSKVLRAAITIYQATPAVKLKSFQSYTMDKKHYQADAGGGGGGAGVTRHLPPSNNLIVSRTCSLKLTMCDISTAYTYTVCLTEKIFGKM